MKSSDIILMPEYFDRYINLVADIELNQAFDESLAQIENFDIKRLKQVGDKAYAPDKWTAKGLVQHVLDFERIFTYRALLFARREGSPTQGVDEKLLGANMKAERRIVEDLMQELKIVRLATKSLFDSFDNEMLQATGINWKFEISVLAMGFTIVGHNIYHFKKIEEQYFPLIENNEAISNLR
jgi:hypothetical protein